ncbi:MAG: nickel-dependent hydrogenase large subunit [Spirochaetales bacterium]|nr:nickel-dependent hydrogenase large subunit [Spirochaetales bacterium]
MATITIDPVTRIEGHLKISVTTDSNNRVTEAFSTGNLYRGFENLLQGRPPRDASFITQRICGVCPVPHGVVSAQAVESAAAYQPTMQALRLRNLMQGANFLGSHILHFYHLAAMDFVKGPAMNPWAPGYEADYRLSSAQNQAVLDNYALALSIRRKAQEMRAIIGGMYTHVGNVLPGGVMAKLSSEQIADFQSYLWEIKSFIKNVWAGDLELLASVYDDYFTIGRGYGNMLCFGAFDIDSNGQKLFPSGVYTNGMTAAFNPANITEDVGFSWYSSGSGLNPANGSTNPAFGKSNAYSWLKAPRYNGLAYEAGPLARLFVSGEYREGVSVMDRHKARWIESVTISENMETWLNQLNSSESSYTPVNPVSGTGAGFTEAPRGALGHWVSVSNSQINRYQIITPTCWNASPKDDNGNPGPIEQAILGTQISKPEQPVEILRIIHSFDPCTACAVHVISPKGKELSQFMVHPGL